MLRISRMTDYAVVVLVQLGRGPEVQTASGLAALTGVPEPTVAKLLKLLTNAGLVASLRGARGGYRLTRPLSAISIAEVIAALEGPIALTACVEGSTVSCGQMECCPMGGRWSEVNAALREALESISLAAMAEGAHRAAARREALWFTPETPSYGNGR
jgi:FeS assembly SUF system regulator